MPIYCRTAPGHSRQTAYAAGMDRGGIAESAEQAVNIAPTFPPDGEGSALLAAVEDCRRWKNESKP